MTKVTQEEVDNKAVSLQEGRRQGKTTTGTLRITSSKSVDLEGANLRDADMRDINLRRAILQGADLGGAIFPDCYEED